MGRSTVTSTKELNEAIEFAEELKVFSYSSSHEGLNSEIKEFFDAKISL